jgi:hypothetical protein
MTLHCGTKTWKSKENEKEANVGEVYGNAIATIG